MRATLMLLSLLALPLAAQPSLAAAATPTIKADGSSTVFPITEAVAEAFQNSKKGDVHVTVGISGTGGGFKKLCRGEIDVQDASRPISKEEMEACRTAGIRYYELPIAFDAMAIVVSTKNTWLKSIKVSELKKMWEPEAQGKIKNWNQVDAKWPDAPLSLFGAGSDSGTFDYFTEAVVGKAKASRGDYTASEDDNTLVMGVANDKNALAYIPFSYYEGNKSKLRLIPVDGEDKAPKKGVITPSKQTVENGTYAPLSRPLFIYVSEAAVARPEVKEFVEFYLNEAAKFAEEVKYVSLPKRAYTQAKGHFNKKRVGTAFGGHAQIGMTIDKLLKKEVSL